ncbi:Satratoxin biosynthesis SC1 cluster protein [Lachnellula occidentalis]|uniref:Satratoxin biosynthesis SC1 cluster protein n=1 Tax=Lachnellula occidentalis TaxID=215460 RepID=A0A8H8RSZ8_9HELO|nr:Satratoxin biosynthesis SC1 cluster protein [Lachnellula occidentalis]
MSAPAYAPPQTLDRAPVVITILGTFLTLSTIAIILRIYCRLVVVKSIGLDDYFILFSWVGYVFFVAFGIASAYHGSGVHTTHLDPANVPIGVEWWWVCEPVYVVANMGLKASIGVLLLKIAVSKIHRAIIWTVLIVTEVYCVVFFFLFVFQCTPVNYFWTRYSGATGHCINPIITINAVYAYSAISCWADWTISILPVFLVWNLQMNSRTKVSVACILLVCAIASTATIIRIPYIKGLKNETDFLYAVTDFAIWSTTETGIGITACCAATLRPLFVSFFANKGSSSGSKIYGGGKGSAWTGNKTNTGYMRSEGKGDAFNSEIALSEGVGHAIVVTTGIVQRSDDLENGDNSSNSSWNPIYPDGRSNEGKDWGVGAKATAKSSKM